VKGRSGRPPDAIAKDIVLIDLAAGRLPLNREVRPDRLISIRVDADFL